MGTGTAAPAHWPPDDQALMRRAVRHVHTAISEGTLPELPASADRAALQGLPSLLPLQALLLTHRAEATPELALLANALACACMGGHHLWQDLGLASRAEVSRLMERGFPALFHANTHHLRWKRHLFLCLGQAVGQADLKPPKCDHCGDFATCMGAPAPPMFPIALPHGR